MEIPKYIVDKIRKQNEYCIKAKDLEDEIDNWCDKSGINIYSKEYDRNVEDQSLMQFRLWMGSIYRKLQIKFNFYQEKIICIA